MFDEFYEIADLAGAALPDPITSVSCPRCGGDWYTTIGVCPTCDEISDKTGSV